ncbi:MAG TPA: LacI family DNA-binding transcriptional regulator [Actinocrinis sp.]|jgi:DNA-binding LacI/PurR family transcriptional regulator|uniref:LacI family DNA-binding transcriptional regulator n=1 Tax=Actinocrinis sp. TaxID=1920516 RepID=UPI002D4834C1|nr:LacI family DNA-binding transcriptional regulator [Actinocrinis sp.]HZU58720.1 LacI family DNA-binding transcriptional regulator [Actinocrinis sp.]
MAVTIRDVARHADVSIATVSRALSAPDLVAERTRARVIEVARQLGYEPNRAARSLITGRTGFIGAVVPDVANPFFLGVLKGVQAAARERGHHVLLADTSEDPVAEAELLSSISRQVDGLILLSSRLPVARLREFPGPARTLRSHGLQPNGPQPNGLHSSTVLFNRVLPGFPAVLLDSGDGIRQIVAHLAALGHRRCAYAGGPRESFADAERRRGLAKACHGTDMRIIDLGSFAPQFASGARVADLALESGATAVIAYNDLVALGVIARLRDRRIDVPLEMSVTGFDDIPMASMGAPRLTTVSLPLEQAGRSAVELLLGKACGGSAETPARVGSDTAPRGRLLPVRLVVRSSTAAARRSVG